MVRKWALIVFMLNLVVIGSAQACFMSPEEHEGVGYQLTIVEKINSKATMGQTYSSFESCIREGNSLGEKYTFTCAPVIVHWTTPCIG